MSKVDWLIGSSHQIAYVLPCSLAVWGSEKMRHGKQRENRGRYAHNTDSPSFALRAVDIYNQLRSYMGTPPKRSKRGTQQRHRYSPRNAGPNYLISADQELRQPIHTLEVLERALDMQALDRRSREITRQMNRTIRKLGANLDAMVAISRLDGNQVAYKPAPLRLYSLVQRIRRQVEPLIKKRQLTYHQQCPIDLWVYTDEYLLQQVLHALLSNAIAFTEKGGIKIAANAHKTGVDIAIADTGCGMSIKEQSRVFEPFYRVGASSKSHSNRLGLGLAIVQRLNSLMGVELTLVSRPGAGSCFNLRLQTANASSSRNRLGKL